MRRFGSIFTLLMAVTLIMFSFSGCNIGSKARRCEALLEEKYGEEFTVLQTWTEPLGTDVFKSEYHAVCYSVNHPEVLLEITVEDFGKKEFTDTYPMGIMAAKVSEILESELSNYFEECYVHAQCLGKCPEFKNYDDVTIESYTEKIENPDLYFFVGVNTDVYHADDYAEEFDFLLETIEEINASLRISGNMTTYFLPSEPYEACIRSFQERMDPGEATDDILEDYYGFAFGFNDVEQEWSFTSWKSSKWDGITKEKYIDMREE